MTGETAPGGLLAPHEATRSGWIDDGRRRAYFAWAPENPTWSHIT